MPRSLTPDDWHFAARLARAFCRRKALRRNDQNDVHQDMVIGMAQAAKRFDEGRGTPFSAFARKRMLGEAVDGLARRGGIPLRHWAHGIRCPRALAEEATPAKQPPNELDLSDPAEVVRLLEPLCRVSKQLALTVHACVVDKSSPGAWAAQCRLPVITVRGMLQRGIRYLQYAHRLEKPAAMENKMKPPQIQPNSSSHGPSGFRKVALRLMTEDLYEQLVKSQIELAKSGDRHALKFVIDQCGLAPARSRSRTSKRAGRSRKSQTRARRD